MSEEELKKGCGTWSEGKVKGVTFQTQCGNTGFKDKVCLCEVCQARLEGFQKGKLEQKKEELEFLKHIKQMLISQDIIRKSDSRPTIRTIQERISFLNKDFGEKEK